MSATTNQRKAELLAYLHDWVDEHGQYPSSSDLDNAHEYPNCNQYANAFGSLTNALRIAREGADE